MTIFYRGKLGQTYVFWNNEQNIPFGVTDIIVVNSPVLTASSVDGPINALNGLTGSLQTLSDGSPYLLAGTNINIVTNSFGQVEITSSAVSTNPGGINTQIQYNNSGAFGGLNVLTFVNGTLFATGSFNGILNGTASLATNSLTSSYSLNADLLDNFNSTDFAKLNAANVYTANQTITGSVIATNGFSGSLTTLANGTPYMLAGTNISLSTGSTGQIQISGTASGTDGQVQFNDGGSAFSGSAGLTFNKNTNTLSTANLTVSNIATVNGSVILGDASSDTVTVSGSLIALNGLRVTGSIAATLGFSGSLTKLTDGTSYIIGGSGVSVSSASNGAITISATGGSASTLQQTYNAGPSTIGLNNSTGSFVISGALSQIGFNYPPLIRLEPGKGGAANYSAIDILGFNGAASASLINIRGNAVIGGGAEITMRSTTGTPSKLTWFSGAGELYGSSATAQIYYHPTDSTLYFDLAGSGQKYIMKDGSGNSGTRAIAEFINAETSFGGKIHLFNGTNVSNAKLYNSGSFEQSGSAKFLSNTFFTGSVGYAGFNIANTADAMLILSGTDTRGGAGYFNFLYVSNSYTSASNRVKNFRLTSDGTLEVISSDYSTNIFALSDAGNLTINGGLTANKASNLFGVKEKFNTKSGATGTVVHDCSTGHVFYHSGATANWTSNFTNLSMSNGYATTITLVVTQSANAYIPSAVQIEGVAQALNWQGNTTPTGTASRRDVIAFSILNVSSSYVVLGQFVSF